MNKDVSDHAEASEGYDSGGIFIPHRSEVHHIQAHGIIGPRRIPEAEAIGEKDALPRRQGPTKDAHRQPLLRNRQLPCVACDEQEAVPMLGEKLFIPWVICVEIQFDWGNWRPLFLAARVLIPSSIVIAMAS